ncbi:MAG TPA: hypothetical protein VHZ03_15215 [Trebonia sp.]|jgi:hypothetical protein|nr:hypothetical protein [Trebonia sp.]
MGISMGFDSQGQQWPPQQQQPPWGQPQQQWQPPQWQPPGQQPQWGPPPGPPPVQPRPGRGKPPRKRSGAGLIFGGMCGLAVIIVIIVAASHGSSTPAASPAASSAPAATGATSAASSPAAPAANTVTYVVTGSDSDVTYGPEGSSLGGSVPMRKTAAIPAKAPGYYSIDAQLGDGGTVTCEILVNGKVISKSTASGSYNIASCEITQGLFSSQWQDANSG